MAEKDYYLKIDGVTGESTKKGHLGEIEMLNWGFGETQSGTAATGTGSASGRVTMQDFHFTAVMGSSSAQLMKLCATGEHIKKAVFTAQRTGATGGEPIEYLIVTFGDCIISSYDVSGSADSLPNENVSFNFTQIQFSYKEIVGGVPKGGYIGGYDVKQNKKLATAIGKI